MQDGPSNVAIRTMNIYFSIFSIVFVFRFPVRQITITIRMTKKLKYSNSYLIIMIFQKPFPRIKSYISMTASVFIFRILIKIMDEGTTTTKEELENEIIYLTR